MKAIPIDVIQDVKNTIKRQQAEIIALRQDANFNKVKADVIEQNMWDLESLLNKWLELFPDTEKQKG